MMRHSFFIGDAEHAVWLARDGSYLLYVDGRAVPVSLVSLGGDAFRLTVDGEATDIVLVTDGDMTHLHLGRAAWSVRYLDPAARHAGHGGGGAEDVAQAPMPGSVVAVHVAAGDAVARGAVMLVIESMKLQTSITAWRDAIVDRVHVVEGQTFDRGAALVSFVPEV
jgi:acetyl/propionyl-CoA carboxylase alpha subunit